MLRQGVEDAAQGQSRSILIVGEAGFGKTRLVHETVTLAARAGVSLWRCSLPEDRPPIPLEPWLAIIRAALAAADAETAQRFLDHAPTELVRQVRGTRGNDLEDDRGPRSAPQSRFELFDATSRMLGTLAARTPRLLLVENLDRADLVTVELLEAVASAAHPGLLVVATRRPIRSFPGDSGQVWRALDQAVRRVELEPLGRDDLERFVEALEGRVHVKASLLARVSEGSPLLVGEAARLLMLGIAPDELAPDGAGLLRQHVGCLADSVRRTLLGAAVIGTELDLASLAETVDQPPERLLPDLDEASRCDVLRPIAEHAGRYAFLHADLQAAVLASAADRELFDLHARVARRLERLPPRTPTLFALAHHSIHAGSTVPRETRAGAARRAGDIAAGLFGFERAAELYDAAIGDVSSISSANPFDRFVLHMSSAYAHRQAGHLEPAIDGYLDAVGVARRHDMPGNLARAVLGLRACIPLWSRGDGLFFSSRLPLDDDSIFSRLHRETPPLLEEAEATAPPGDRTLHARLLAHLADVSPPERRRALSQRALRLGAGTQDATTQLDVLSSRLHALWQPDDIEEILRVTESLAELAERASHPTWAWEAHFRLLLLALTLGEPERAQRQRRALERIAQRARHPDLPAALEIIRTNDALAEGRFDDAEKMLDRAAATAEGNSPHFAMARLLQFAELWRARGKPDTFTKAYERVLRKYSHLGTIVTALVAHAQLEAGRPAEARALYRSIVKAGFDRVPRDGNYLATLAHLAELAASFEDKSRIGRLYELLKPYAGQSAVMFVGLGFGSMSRYLGLLAAAKNDRVDAERRYRDALGINERMGARVQLALSQLELARLLAEGDEASRARARSEIARARKTAHALSMPGLSERLERLAASQ